MNLPEAPRKIQGQFELTFRALHTAKGFLIAVGMLSSWIVMILFLLNWFFPIETTIECVNTATGETGLAVRGRGVNASITLTDKYGQNFWQVRAVKLNCTATFGEGWTKNVAD